MTHWLAEEGKPLGSSLMRLCVFAPTKEMPPGKINLLWRVSFLVRKVLERLRTLRAVSSSQFQSKAGDREWISLALAEGTDITNTACFLFEESV